jgi:hypothetical protein
MNRFHGKLAIPYEDSHCGRLYRIPMLHGELSKKVRTAGICPAESQSHLPLRFVITQLEVHPERVLARGRGRSWSPREDAETSAEEIHRIGHGGVQANLFAENERFEHRFGQWRPPSCEMRLAS